MSRIWEKKNWRNFPIQQQPNWPEKDVLENVLTKLSSLPSLVFSGETRRLRLELGEVNKGKNFILQVGNCSESFDDCNGPKIHNFLRIVLQMAMILGYNSNKKIIKIGRIAGQYAKPRSTSQEIIDGVTMDCYRGDIVNDYTPTPERRTPDPARLMEGYFRSAATLNLIRAFTQGGYSDVGNLQDWKKHFFPDSISKLGSYKDFEGQITSSLSKTSDSGGTADRDIIYVSHEALLLDYEEAFTRIDTTTGGFYSTTAHSLWIGNRTRQWDGAHVEYVSGLGNPIGIKVGCDFDVAEIVEVIRKINPENDDDKIILISRMGAKEVFEKLPSLVQGIKKNKLNVIWSCDPMHGNTFSHNGYKVRSFDDIVFELKAFFQICKLENVVPGGIHLEITGEFVSECIGGLDGLSLANLGDNYTTKVDPRLNAAQALEIGFLVSKLM